MKKQVALMLSTILICACGAETPASKTSDTEEQHAPLLVVVGGNTSCKPDEDGVVGPRGLNNWYLLQDLVADISSVRGIAPSWIATCHGSDSVVQIVASDEPQAPHTSTDFDGLYAKIDALANGRHVLIAGHSYGGWLAMKAATAVTADVGALVTIDPISRATCSVLTPFGCMEAPRDFNNAARQAIADRVGTWSNFYQTQTFYLHSAPMSQADENVLRETTHGDIDTDDALWERIHTLAANL